MKINAATQGAPTLLWFDVFIYIPHEGAICTDQAAICQIELVSFSTRLAQGSFQLTYTQIDLAVQFQLWVHVADSSGEIKEIK